MALKRKTTKAEFDVLDKALQLQYKAEGEDFVLDVTGFDDPGELRRAKDREVEEHKTTKEELKKSAARVLELEKLVDPNTAKDIKTIEKSWKEKLDTANSDHGKVLETKDRQINALLIDGKAQEIASELGGENAHLLLPFVKARLSPEFDGDKALIRVLNEDGTKSALSVDDLKKEFKEAARFARVVVASSASGGATGQRRPNGGAGNGSGNNEKKFHQLNDVERKEWYARDPKGFSEASAASRKELLAARPVAQA